MKPFLESLAHKYIDKVLRLRNKIRRLITGTGVFSKNDKLSDSQASFYVDSLRKITSEPDLRKFRRNFDYREILEHVDYKTGKSYIERINQLGYSINELIEYGLPNDLCGHPRSYQYGKLPKVSPTTLRYLSVACELRSKFGSLDDMNILEIGAGYGGQMSIISRMFNIGSYSIYDLPEAQSLISKYARNMNLPNVVKMLDINNIENSSYDLVVSNYAYSELPRGVQTEYAQKILTNSTRGYMIMNSGLKNATPRSDGKINCKELEKMVSGISIVKEIPITGVDNYVVIWNHSVASK